MMIEDDIKHIKALANSADMNAKDALIMVQLLIEHLELDIKINDKYGFNKKANKK